MCLFTSGPAMHAESVQPLVLRRSYHVYHSIDLYPCVKIFLPALVQLPTLGSPSKFQCWPSPMHSSGDVNAQMQMYGSKGNVCNYTRYMFSS